MTILEQFVEKARRSPRRILLPEWDDPRIQAAAEQMAAQGLAEPVRCDVDAATLDQLADNLAQTRDKLTPATAKRLLKKPLYLAGQMLKSGLGDAMVAGATCPTRRVIEAGSMTVGLAPNIAVPSSFFIMDLGVQTLVFADCAVNAEPSSEELAAIGMASARSASALLGVTPKVAFLSFATFDSAQHASIDRVRNAVQIAQSNAPTIAFDGPLQADAALVKAVAAKKLDQESAVAGGANVLIFPDLNSGNIAYKLVQYLAGAQAIGPILQGFARPIADLSRGASIDDIVATSAIISTMTSTED